MKRLIGILVIVQALLTYLILESLNNVSVSLTEAAVHMESGGLTLSWSDQLPFLTYAVLVIVVILGIYISLVREKKPE
jgi:uncharacterized membrane protein YqhA